eukprot:18994-Heterococcus_DN1.PRE.1
MQLERAQINAPQLTSPPANVKRLVVEKRVSRVVVCCALPELHYATAAHDAAACCLLAIYLAKKRIACNWCTLQAGRNEEPAVARPHIRILPEARARRGLEAKQGGCKHVTSAQPAAPRSQGVKQILSASRKSGYDVVDAGLQLQSKHVVIDKCTGQPAENRIAEERTLEKDLGFKRKCMGVLHSAKPSHCSIDYTPDFFKKGEVVTGSGFFRSKHVPAEGLASKIEHTTSGGISYSRKCQAARNNSQKQSNLYVRQCKLAISNALTVRKLDG